MRGFSKSAAHFPDLVLDEPSRRPGELIHGTDADHTLAVDEGGALGVGVGAHVDGSHSHPLAAEGTDLVGGVPDGGVPGVLVTEGVARGSGEAVNVVGAGVGEDQQELPVSGG